MTRIKTRYIYGERYKYKMISGVLERLTVTACGLTDIFAAQAVFQLRKNRKLKQLFMQHNNVTVDGHRVLLKVLRKNKGLQDLSINISEEPDVSELFDVLREGHFSRLIIGWIDPPGHVFAEGHDLCKLSSAIVYLDHRSLEDATLFLDTLVSYRQINALTIDCTDSAIPDVVHKMIDTLAKVKYLRQLHLNLKGLAPNFVLDVIRALEVNKSVHMLFFAQTTFDEKAIKALGRMVENNKTLNMLSIDLEKSDGDRVYQMRGICARLKEAILRNRYLVSLSVAVDTCNRASDYRIKDALRRNMMLVHDAVQFVNGSSEKSDGIAFERLRFSFSIKMVLLDQFDVPENEAKVKIDRAKQRLITDYFILTRIVKYAVVCKRTRRYKKYMLDCLKGDLMLRVCSYLSLTDILDV
ncbi:hypothetical protein HPB50_015164 [Hyalomma asiaticum]|uniref:Uncharacterized protein n=1 Tax=Hyalomma asiaticum TaxID=266040 RepID=A0ACB7RM54_HYAAI|nr:hypothetical protein HPB50_015164 [Hyalomma asiaticum]